ncbi:hypothetical protein K1F50_12270 [Muricauda oceani]|uniref:Aerotolerance regulator N-terminal domain-containing protein n=1 Tax=Flagellimonas oceani TaxID=2698672 RepID=A0A6G7J0S8_9FLAO|nr:hypothetical protein [Allomuricauda oceani]MBW8243577.1 hypothetical protein [Allomuricauda oceani]QII44052.1 hypothetical protein GVT53_04985 [Allomuricauda oceani]
MSDGVVFMNPKLVWPIILMGLVLWSVFVWKEWPQRRERRFWPKLIASFFALSSLVMIILKPGTFQKSTKGKAIVLTNGYRPEQLDSLKSIYKRIKTVKYTKGQTLSILTDTDSIFLMGHGLAPYDFWQLEDKSVAFLGGEAITGWTSISYKKKVVLGDFFKVDAKYANPKNGHWAVLVDNGGNPLDSVVFGEQQQIVKLRAAPKASGRFVYGLLEKDDEGNLISKEPLPVEVEKGAPLKVALINTFPTFETKYLKNFLTEKGHQVLARTQLTKGKYKFEYFNGASSPIYGFTSENLKEYDLLVLDSDSYAGLTGASKQAMEAAMESSGLGVFVQPSQGLFSLSESRSPFKFIQDYKNDINLGAPVQNLSKYPYQFKEAWRAQEILLDSVTIASYLPMQRGKVGTTLLQNTYQLVLDGKENLYARIWTQILNSITRERETLVSWKAITRIPRTDEPFHFELRTALNDVEVKTNQDTNIPLLQDGLLINKWTGVEYPRATGWNQLRVSNDSVVTFPYFVYDDNQLQTLEQDEVLRSNHQKFGSEPTFGTSISESRKVLHPISLYWFYIVLLLGMGWLWLEPKLAR